MEGILLFIVGVLSIGAIYGILCLALNLEAGVDGLWDLGIVSFFGVGAYTYTLLTAVPAEGHQHYVLGLELPIWIGVMGAGLAGGIVALVIGSPSLRLKQEYFLITTLAFAEVIRQIYANELWLTNGVAGIHNLTPPFREALALDPDTQQVALLALFLVALAIAYWIVQSLTVSPFGRGLKALRENEALAKTAGINPFAFHIRAFVTCGVMTGIAGSFYVWYSTIIIPGMFVADITFFVWTAIIIGGIGNNRGALIGGFLFISLYEALRFVPNLIRTSSELTEFLAAFGITLSELTEGMTSVRIALVGVALIVVLRLKPNGLFHERPQSLRVRAAE